MSKSTPSSRSLHRSIHWFRKGLRLHDNPALLAACKDGEQVRPVFILDPWFAKNARVGINRWRFLLQSLQDLDNALRSLNGRLYVVRGKPCEVLPTLFRDWRISRLTYEVDTEPYARERDEEVEKVAEEHGVKVVTAVSHTLYDTERVAARNGGKPPLTYQACQKILSQLGPPPKPCPTLSLDTLDGVTLPVDDDHDSCYGVPTLEDLGKSSTDCGECLYPGGESHALQRMELCIKKTEWICKFEKPKTEPNTLAPSTTVLSPYLKFGCLSPRLFYVKLKEVYAKSKHSQPPVSLEGQLLWREFFYVVGANTPNFDRMQGNRVCRQIPWQQKQEWLDAWTQGRTGYPFIDAIMTQLRQEGWIHHLARHAVACFLTRGDLWISWEEGMKVFDELLLDADWSLNAGNWMWLSASAFFHQYFRVYSPVAFGKKTDKQGDYIRKYLPQLKKFPAQYIYEPWTASLGVQKAAGCIIGEEYPRPIVDHDKARQQNIKRMAEAYGASKQENNSVAANPGKRKNDQASNSKKKAKLK